MLWQRKRRRNPEIEPDEIFLDAATTASFNRNQFEGRLEKPLSRSTFFFLSAILGGLFCVLLARSAQLELVQGTAFAQESANNSLSATTLFAPRGAIVDVNGVPLAQNVAQSDGSVQRYYALPSMGQIIGYVSYPKKDSHGVYYDTKESGVAGLEAEYNAMLSGKNGQLLAERDALGRILSEGDIVPAQPGQTLHLSINANLEQLFARALKNVTIQQHFVAAAGVIMDVHSGAVQAIVSYPSYDPNVMSSGGPVSAIAAYSTDPGHPFLDHAVQGVYTPGSIVKPFEASGALTDGVITSSTTIDDTGLLTVPDPYHPGEVFRYTGWKALGVITVRQAIAWSSDVFFYTVGGGYGPIKGLGINRLDYWYRRFGMGTTTGIDLPGEATGLVPGPAWKRKTFNQAWYLGDTYFTAIGQYGMQVTPIQMARATAAIANGGTLYTPTLLAGDKTSSIPVPVSSAALQVVREGMRLGVTGTTLIDRINLPYLAVAAKTGTAQVGSHNQYDNTWVEGFFPYDHPEYAFAVVLERGPSGEGEDAVWVMQQLFGALHAENSPYVGGTALHTDVLATSTPALPPGG